MPEGRVVPYDLFLQSIGKHSPAPIYIIYGNEDLFAQTVLKQIKKWLLGDDASTNLTEADEESEPARLFDILRTRSLFGPSGHQVVVVYNGEKFIKKHEKLLERYARNPSPKGSLILLVAGGEKESEKQAKQLAAKFAPVIDCRSPSTFQLPAMVTRMAGKVGKTIDADATRLLITLAGTDLAQLHHQLQNLADLIKDRPATAGKPRITEKDVVDLVGTDFQRSIWELSRMVSEKKTREALLILDRLLRQEDEREPAAIIGLLAYELRQIAAAKGILSDGGTETQALHALMGPKFIRERKLAEAKRLTQEEIDRRLHALAEADLQCKTSSLPVQTALEMLILKLCRPPAGRMAV